MNTMLKMVAFIAFVVFVALGGANAADTKTQADWELWPDKTRMPPDDQLGFLPIIATGESIAYIWIDLGDQTLEKDGKQYKVLQPYQDSKFMATTEVGKYLFGLVGTFYPTGTVDPIAMLKAFRMVSVEIDGTVIPIDQSYLLKVEDVPFKGQTSGLYNVFPRFNTLGTHTYIETWRQEEPFFYIEPFAEEALCTECGYPPDPFPEFGGRYVYVPGEQVGDPVDGNIVVSYTLTVEQPTAVESLTWGRIKGTFR